MREDVLVDVVHQRCEALKRSGLWLGQPRIRPEAWLSNFEEQDQKIAALLLDRFVFCNNQTTDSLLRSAWDSIGDGLPKMSGEATPEQLIHALGSVVFTPVEGEAPKPTDSGNFMCRKARQQLGVPDDIVMSPGDALACARTGTTVVFLDDFVGSGDQFIKTWTRDYGAGSYRDLRQNSSFTAIYVNLIATKNGAERIGWDAPEVAVCSAHTLTEKSTIYGLVSEGIFNEAELKRFLRKYSSKLKPVEPYIANNQSYLTYGYNNLGLFLGFEHSIPDATLPIFWSPGLKGWEPLIERL